jgi:transcriptional regulator with XRE-family HTH domain
MVMGTSATRLKLNAANRLRLDPAAARAARLSLGLTQANIAAQIGRTQAYFSLFERGLRPLRPNELRLLQAILSAPSSGP